MENQLEAASQEKHKNYHNDKFMQLIEQKSIAIFIR